MSELVGVRFEPDLFNQIEEWRRQQARIPQRPEAIRALVVKGLAASKTEAERKGRKPS
jgi:hypothetical protein